MKANRWLRQHWHDLYYALDSRRLEAYAHNCREVSAWVDSGNPDLGLSGRLRILLHLSLCQACRNYLGFTRALQTALRRALPKPDASRLNADLLKKFSHPQKRGGAL